MVKSNHKGRASFLIDAARRLEPYTQGELDGLCGLYAIINAIRIATLSHRKDNLERNCKLFQAGLAKLSLLGNLTEFVGEGMEKHEVRILAKTLCREASDADMVVHSIQLPIQIPPAERKANIMSVLKDGYPVLLDLEHKSHYSVAVGYSPSTLTLFDSYGYLRTQPLEDRCRRSIAIVAIPAGKTRRPSLSLLKDRA